MYTQPSEELAWECEGHVAEEVFLVKEILDLPLYAVDRRRYGSVYDILSWYRKHRGIEWLKGQNFGDYLSLVIVGEIVRRRKRAVSPGSCDRRLMAVGSVLHFARDSDVVWGSGVNGKIPPSRHTFNELDVRMVRGPLTKQFLEARGIPVGEVFGDPVLLLPHLFPGLSWRPQTGKIIAIPNLNEVDSCRRSIPAGLSLVSPYGYWKKVVGEILTSELVLTSSLHGLVVAEAFGVPVRFIMPTGGETLFKYQDYYLGTGRNLEEQPSAFCDGVSSTSGVAMPLPSFDAAAMLAAFPWDMFSRSVGGGAQS